MEQGSVRTYAPDEWLAIRDTYESEVEEEGCSSDEEENGGGDGEDGREEGEGGGGREGET